MRIVVLALARASRRHRLRTVAAILGVMVGVALSAGVASLSDAVVRGVRGGLAIDLVDADVVALARSAAGIDEATTAQLTAATAGQATAVPVLRADTRLADDDEAVIAVVGTTIEAAELLPEVQIDADSLAPPAEGAYSLVLSAGWAADHGIEQGEVIELIGPGGPRPWTVVGVVDADLPNDQAIAVSLIDQVGEAFGRPGRVDALYFSFGAEGGDVEALESALRTAGGSAVTVGPPESVVSAEVGSVELARQMFFIAVLAGLAIAAAVIFVSWRLLIEDERREVARLRLVGASAPVLARGSATLFVGMVVVAALAGLPLALLMATMLANLSTNVVRLTGIAGIVQPSLSIGNIALGLGAGLGTTAVAWAFGLRSLLRVPAIEAIRDTEEARSRSLATRPLLGIGAAAVVALALLSRADGLVPSVLALGCALVATIALAISLPITVGRLLGRSSRFDLMSAGRECAVRPRGRTGTVVVFSVAAMLAVTVEGLAASFGAGLQANIDGYGDYDLYVLGGRPGLVLRDERLDEGDAQILAGIEGVEGVLPYSSSYMRIGDGAPVPLWAWDPAEARVGRKFDVHEGLDGDDLWAAIGAGDIAITRNLAIQRDLELGQQLELPGSAGSQPRRIVSVVDDIESTSGAVLASLQTMKDLTGEIRLDNVALRLAEGESTDAVEQRVEEALGPTYPNLEIFDQRTLHDILLGLVGQALAVLHGLALLFLALAVLVVATTAAASLAARRSALSLTRLIGAPIAAVRAQLRLEFVIVAVLAWLIAVPVGGLSIEATVHAVGAESGLLPPVRFPVLAVLALLPLAVASILAAAALPMRSVLSGPAVLGLKDD